VSPGVDREFNFLADLTTKEQEQNKKELWISHW
jgi:hypothetical protein